MELLALTCSKCGAPIKVPKDISEITCGHCGTPLRVMHEGDAYFTLRLDQIEARTETMERELSILRMKQALEELDRKWENVRMAMLPRNKEGKPIETGKTGLIFMLVVGLIITFLWIGMAFAMGGAPIILPIFGAAFAGFLIFLVVRSYRKMDAYEQLKGEYLRNREALVQAIQKQKGEGA